MKNINRRRFLKSLAALTGTALLPTSLLADNSIVTGKTGKKPDLSGWKMSGAHWGAFRANVQGDKLVEVQPFEFDQFPTDILQGVPGIIYSPSRVRYPMVRVDWYKNRHKSDTTQRGDNRFVRVGWDAALDMVYEELERIQKDYGPWALHTANVGWRSVGQIHSCGNHMLRAVAMHGRSVGTAGDYSTGAGQVIMPYV